jgi:hypothetical protein
VFRNSADNSAQTIPKRRSSGGKIVGIFQINTKRTQCTKKAALEGLLFLARTGNTQGVK